MAEVRGRRCDRPGCTTFEEDAPNIPIGWVQVIPKTSENGKVESYELCSNRCAAWLFLDRHEAETGKRLNRQTGKPRGPYKKKDKTA